MKGLWMKLGRNLKRGFGVCLITLLLLDGIGLYTLQQITDKCNKVIHVDAKILELSQRFRADINSMRRYEKDTFINISDPAVVDEYVAKWGTARDELKTNMDVPHRPSGSGNARYGRHGTGNAYQVGSAASINHTGHDHIARPARRC